MEHNFMIEGLINFVHECSLIFFVPVVLQLISLEHLIRVSSYCWIIHLAQIVEPLISPP